jgi:hypothetical protein
MKRLTFFCGTKQGFIGETEVSSHFSVGDSHGNFVVGEDLIM